MSEYRKETHTVQVPKNTGRHGFLRALDRILTLSKVQTIVIKATGLVTYERFVAPGEKDPVGVDYDGLEPYHVIRNGEVIDVPVQQLDEMWRLLFQLFGRAELERLVPVALVTGGNTLLWELLRREGVPSSTRLMLFGLPVLADRGMPDHTVTLCTAFERTAALIDCHRFFKMDITPLLGAKPPPTTVDVL